MRMRSQGQRGMSAIGPKLPTRNFRYSVATEGKQT